MKTKTKIEIIKNKKINIGENKMKEKIALLENTKFNGVENK